MFFFFQRFMLSFKFFYFHFFIFANFIFYLFNKKLFNVILFQDIILQTKSIQLNGWYWENTVNIKFQWIILTNLCLYWLNNIFYLNFIIKHLKIFDSNLNFKVFIFKRYFNDMFCRKQCPLKKYCFCFE